MIQSFRHKGLKELFNNGKTNKLPQERISKVKLILTAIHTASVVSDLNNPALRLHKLKSPPHRGYWSLDVNGNYRIIFEFKDGQATNLDYLDTH
ncbi:MAG: type II toxin-antitoxin system RelE/ParE family toxin [Cytophagales bacterium]|nr:type II toxin-antitoxin system RelE/ParE family toxin [Cytophagales bacterium]